MRTGAPVSDCGPTDDDGDGGGPERTGEGVETTGGTGSAPGPTAGAGGGPRSTDGVGVALEPTCGEGDVLTCIDGAVEDGDSVWMEMSPEGMWASGDGEVCSLEVAKGSSPGVTEADMVEVLVLRCCSF